jgi:hypothetical protein
MRDPSSTVVFRWLAAGDAGDLNAFDELLHPDAIIHAPAGLSQRVPMRRRQCGGTL